MARRDACCRRCALVRHPASLSTWPRGLPMPNRMKRAISPLRSYRKPCLLPWTKTVRAFWFRQRCANGSPCEETATAGRAIMRGPWPIVFGSQTGSRHGGSDRALARSAARFLWALDRDWPLASKLARRGSPGRKHKTGWPRLSRFCWSGRGPPKSKATAACWKIAPGNRLDPGTLGTQPRKPAR